jgi:hypothetical protein
MIDNNFPLGTAECEAHKYAVKILSNLDTSTREVMYNEIYEAYIEGYKLSQQLNK